MKLFKRKAEPPVFEPVRELSGIEKVALEAEYNRQGDIADRDRERREKLQARILEIEKKIGPQLAELRRIRAELNPYLEYVNALPPGVVLRGTSGDWTSSAWPRPGAVIFGENW